MQNNDFRAKQFMPFDALKGFKEAIKMMEIKKTSKKELLDDRINNLNNKIKLLNKNSNVLIKYYSGIDYIETSGNIKKVDDVNKCIYILNSKIFFDDILDIELLDK